MTSMSHVKIDAACHCLSATEGFKAHRLMLLRDAVLIVRPQAANAASCKRTTPRRMRGARFRGNVGRLLEIGPKLQLNKGRAA